jgi:hypothetical protein
MQSAPATSSSLGIPLRTLRIAVLAAALILVALPSGAYAATVPGAPFTALALSGSFVNPSVEMDSANASVSVTAANGTGSSDEFLISGTDGSHQASVEISLQGATARLTAGMSYSVQVPGQATDVALTTTVNLVGCQSAPGTLTVSSLSRDPSTQVLTSLAATYQVTCDNQGPVFGDIRFNSTSPYVATVASDPGEFVFDQIPMATQSPPATLLLTGRGPTPIQFNAATISGPNGANFTVVANNCSGHSLAYGQTCTISVVGEPTAAADQDAMLTLADNATGGQLPFRLLMTGVGSLFQRLAPARILDTRSGLGAPQQPMGPNSTLHLKIGGTLSIPTTGVTAVVLNVTATNVTGPSFLTVSPTGQPRPLASSLNVVKGFTGANSVTVGLGTNGSIDIFNNANSADVIVDIIGYYATTSANLSGGGQVHLLPAPTRILDTRSGSPVSGGAFVQVPADLGAAANAHVRGFLVNITATNPRGPGFLAAFDGNPDNLPGTSTLNYGTGQTVPNFAVVPAAQCDSTTSCSPATGLPIIGVLTNQTTDVIVDLVGYIDDGTVPDGLLFTPITPTRIADSRTGLGIATTLGQGRSATVTTPTTVPALLNTEALALNVTAVNPTANTFVTVWPSGQTRPGVSNLNPARGQTIPNAAATGLDSSGRFDIFNNAGSVDIVIDVNGIYTFNSATAP